MGGMIAQQLTLNYPDKVDDLIIYASSCGGNQSIAPNQQIVDQFASLEFPPVDILEKQFDAIFS
jgi:pimeloyl-ACP methyl ester carboxylesterase